MNARQLIKNYQERAGAMCQRISNNLEVTREVLARGETPLLPKGDMLLLIETLAKIEALERVAEESNEQKD